MVLTFYKQFSTFSSVVTVLAFCVVVLLLFSEGPTSNKLILNVFIQCWQAARCWVAICRREMQMCHGCKRIGYPLIFGLVLTLSGCGGSDELDKQLTHSANLTLVNSLGFMTDFHVKKRGISTGDSGLFESDSLVFSDVPAKNHSSVYRYSYQVTNNMVNVGVKDSVNANKELKASKTLSNGSDLWVIAWETSGERALSVIDKKQQLTKDVFNVRLFANGRYDVTVAGKRILTTEKGKVTDYLTVNNCARDLKVAEHVINLCAGNLGASYLLVANENGALVMVAE
jgi:hypothetical protein